MATNKDPLKKIESTKSANDTLLDEVQDHFDKSDRYIENLRKDWDDKEAMLLGKNEDSLSKKTKSKINDPRLSTIVFERSARVMNKPAEGQAYAESQDDVGKNMFMNLLLGHFRKKDNDQYSHLMKLRFTNMYSHVYGSSFGLVPWRVNPRTGFVGPAYNVLRMRDCFPQPGVSAYNEWDYFNHSTWVGITWLLNQDPEYWDMDEIKLLAEELKNRKSSGDTRDKNKQDSQSYVERTRFPDSNLQSDKFPQVQIITEYRRDKWITYTPQQPSSKDSRPHILRIVTNPYPNGMLPIVVKHSFPLLDSPIGLGEFERGQTLQFAMNSLVNLYMDGVKYSIFPPIAVDPNNVVPSSIKWGAGERWYMNTPGRDVQPISISPQGLQTFQSTYDFLLNALYNQSGTTSVNDANKGAGGLGKTPEAIRFVSERQSARDEWDRFMMEDTIQQIYDRWIPLITNNLDAKISMRMFGEEAKMIAKRYPDIEELLKKKDSRVKKSKSGDVISFDIGKKDVGGPDEKYDWVIEAGSTMQDGSDSQGEAVTDILKAVFENGEKIEAALNKKGKTLDVGELFSRYLEVRKLGGVDKIIVDMTANPDPNANPNVNPTVTPPVNPNEVIPPTNPAEVVPVNPAQPPVASVEPQMPEFKDPDLAKAASAIFGGVSGIPAVGA